MAHSDPRPPKISVGFRAGKLTVEAPTSQRKSGYIVWQCRCDCGGMRMLDTRTLQRGTITDCGCVTRVGPGQNDLTGVRFGKLVCLHPTAERGSSGGVVWVCQCDCGKTCTAVSTQLRKGFKKSCGCESHPPLKEFPGQRFGQLTVIAYAGKRSGMHRWRCRCDCGQETVVGQTLLQNGKTKSCGCLRSATLNASRKLCNGTSVTQLESTALSSSNTSGVKGVYRRKKDKKWTAQITFQGKTYYLGSFEQLEDAIQARREGETLHRNFLEWYYAERTERETQHTQRSAAGKQSGPHKEKRR